MPVIPELKRLKQGDPCQLSVGLHSEVKVNLEYITRMCLKKLRQNCLGVSGSGGTWEAGVDLCEFEPVWSTK